MLSNSQIKHIQSLHLKKKRSEHNEFIVEGLKMVNELENSIIKVKTIYCTDLSLVFPFENTILVSKKELERISLLKSPNTLLAICEIPEPPQKINVLDESLTLVLDDIKDPGNLGTIIRIADWFGIKNIVCSLNTVDVYNPKVVQSTMGSIARVNVVYANLESFFKNHSNLPVFGAFMTGESVYECYKPKKAILVLGNESKGISEITAKFITNKITIPAVGKAESLNAAVATGIICSYFLSNKK